MLGDPPLVGLSLDALGEGSCSVDPLGMAARRTISMMSWMPFGIGLLITALLNFFPYFMAFVVRSEKWRTVGWFYYLFTLPIGLVAAVIGLVVSLVLVARS